MIQRLKSIRNRRLAIATAVYWFLLVYIIAALVWWFIELERQNRQMAAIQIHAIASNHADYNQQVDAINEDTRRHTFQFAMEGITFLALIMLSAGYVYRALRRQIRLQQQQQNFMMAVTHELKTPIAVSKLNLETLQKHQLDREKTQKLIRNTLQETNRLNQLANNILVSSQLDGGRYTVTREEIDLSRFLEDSVQDFGQRFPDRNWTTDIQPSVELIGDPLLIGILINNLLENAYKYSPKGSAIQARLHTSGDYAIMEFLDEGPGIPDSEKKNIFQQFYRIGNEQTRTTKGTGLGLHLCRKIAADHQGKILVKDNQPKGSNFMIRFRR